MKEAAGPATGGLGFYCQSSAAQETLEREVISFSEKTCYTLSLFFECLFLPEPSAVAFLQYIAFYSFGAVFRNSNASNWIDHDGWGLAQRKLGHKTQTRKWNGLQSWNGSILWILAGKYVILKSPVDECWFWNILNDFDLQKKSAAVASTCLHH